MTNSTLNYEKETEDKPKNYKLKKKKEENIGQRPWLNPAARGPQIWNGGVRSNHWAKPMRGGRLLNLNKYNNRTLSRLVNQSM